MSSLVNQLELEPKKAAGLKGNLNQLCGWNKVGVDLEGRKEAAIWQLLEDVRWLERDDSRELVPLVGKYQHMFETVIQPHPAIACQDKRTLKNLLN